MKNHLEYNWWIYLLILILPIFLWCSVFNILAKPAPEEQLNVLYVGQQLDAQALQQQLEQAMPALTQQELLQIHVNTEIVGPAELSMILTARIFYYDLIIVQESYCTNYIGQNVFGMIPPALLEQFPDAQIYTEEIPKENLVLNFGFIVYDGTTRNRFSAHYQGEETCYLFLSPKSVNFDTLNKNGEKGNDAALKAAQYLLEAAP